MQLQKHVFSFKKHLNGSLQNGCYRAGMPQRDRHECRRPAAEVQAAEGAFSSSCSPVHTASHTAQGSALVLLNFKPLVYLPIVQVSNKNESSNLQRFELRANIDSNAAYTRQQHTVQEDKLGLKRK